MISTDAYAMLNHVQGLKTGVEMAFFWSVIRSGFGDTGGTPPPKIPRSNPRWARTDSLSVTFRLYTALFFTEI